MLYWVHCQLPDLGNATIYFKRYPSLWGTAKLVAVVFIMLWTRVNFLYIFGRLNLDRCWVITLGPCLKNSKLSYCTREANLVENYGKASIAGMCVHLHESSCIFYFQLHFICYISPFFFINCSYYIIRRDFFCHFTLEDCSLLF